MRKFCGQRATVKRLRLFSATTLSKLKHVDVETQDVLKGRRTMATEPHAKSNGSIFWDSTNVENTMANIRANIIPQQLSLALWLKGPHMDSLVSET